MHWNNDVATALNKDTPFSSTFLPQAVLPTNPYKTTDFLANFNTNKFFRSALSMVLRFWLTPSRTRKCPCSNQTNCLVKHLLFSCSNTRDQIANYKDALPIELSTDLCPSKLTLFFRKIARSKSLLENFNLMISRFELTYY